MKKRPACPTPHKHSHRNQREAEQHAKQQARQTIEEGQIAPPIYGYPCPCGKWHVTRDAKGPHGDTNTLLVDWPLDLQEWAING